MTRRIALLLFVLGSITAVAATTATDTVGMFGTPIRVAVGPVTKPIRVFVFASGDEILKQETTVAKIVDMSGNADAVEVAFDHVDVASVSQTSVNNKLATSRIEWSADMTIKGAVPPAKTLTREAQLVVGTAQRHFTYELTSKVTPLTWTLNQPIPAVAVEGDLAALGFSVTAAGEGDRTSARITRSTVHDASNRPVDTRVLSLAHVPVVVGLPSAQRLMVDGNQIPAGNYTGTIEIALFGAADAKTFDLAIASTPRGARVKGWFCVLAGVLLAIFLGGFLRNYIGRMTALVPANRIRDLLTAEEEKLKVINANQSAETRKWIGDLSKLLEPRALSGYIPGWVPAAFGGNVDAQGYTDYLKARGDELAAITYLVERGFLLVTQYTQNHAAIDNAYGELEELAVKRPADLLAQTDAIIDALKPKTKGATTAEDSATTLTHHIVVRVDAVNAAAWLIFAVIASVTGYLAAVNVAGFGVAADYFKAFLWGFGLQTAGTQLQQLTPSSIASTIGITMPKSS
jgi:hypothetical protein